MSIENVKNNWGKLEVLGSFRHPKVTKLSCVPYLFALDLYHFGHLIVTEFKEIKKIFFLCDHKIVDRIVVLLWTE